jgi:hypothetical protein
MKSTHLAVPLFAIVSVLTISPARAQEPPMIAFSPMNIEFMSGPIAFDNEPVTGAPYTAEAVTEMVQTLADGNRIVRENKAQITRDGRGRTRREQGLAMFGPLVGDLPGGDQPRHIQISDPANKTTIMLDPQHRVAHRVPAPHFKIAALNRAGIKVQGTSVDVDHFEMALPAPPQGMESAASGTVHVYSGRKVVVGSGTSEPVVENFGQQFMDGVTVEGTKTTVTIPAGHVGNELPIKIVSERWFSPDLKVLVMSRQSDPRFGETTYRLTNITRGEPAPELFEVPADYQVIDPVNKLNRDVVIERKPR